ncbi:FAD-dependent monooxygenase [Phenylobacterium montanum]|uniref:FAD-dependent monooxygenase n=1 Tax=Phenylobacterium montanum TaxID=2823693 RepID=A0A975IVE8_9CAUL|nr:FAD-dependent monooxygenase [Caulobacter sp. S6]QUD88499.1 FAD-dependent monooxygenase [Caulobacter sp. S6]
MQTEVLIVGAGPTGLVLALWLARLGVAVRIVDRAPEPGMSARAFALQARTLELYDRLGIAREAIARGRMVDRLHVHHDGRSHAIPLGDFGRGISPFPFVLVLLQDEHERLLIEHLAEAGVQVERGVELVDLDDRGPLLRARLRGPTGGDRLCEAAYVCGCDGVGSIVRQLVGIDFPGRSLEEFFYVADVEARGGLADGDLHYVMNGQELCSVFPRRGRGRLRLIGLVPRSVRERLSQFGFEDLRPQIEQDTGLEIGRVESFAAYRVRQRIAETWRRGRAFLLGDAAHVHSPAGGQGLNAGVGDAVNLAWKLGAVLRGGADEALLGAYEAERREAARQIAATTDRGFTMQAQRGGLAAGVRGALIAAAPELMRLSGVARWLFGVISQVGVSYRGGEACWGRAGRVRGGDRLPWVKPLGEPANFDTLQPPFPLEPMPPEGAPDGPDQPVGAYRFTERALGFGWQAQVYGEPRAPLRDACAEWGLGLQRFPWTPEARRAGLARDALYLVRPDGYVGFADSGQSVRRLAAYLERFDIRFRSAPGGNGALHTGLGAPHA